MKTPANRQREIFRKTVHGTFVMLLWFSAACIFGAGFVSARIFTKPPAPVVVTKTIVAPVTDARARKICLHSNGYIMIVWVPNQRVGYKVICADDRVYDQAGALIPQ